MIIKSLTINALLLFVISCSQKKDNKEQFLKENPEAKKYIDFLDSYRDKLLAIDNAGFKMTWRLHVYCEDFEKRKVILT